MSQPASRAQSRAPSVASEHEGGPSQQSASARRRSRNRRGRSRTPRSLSASSEDEGLHDAPRRKRGGKKGGGLPAVGEVDEAASAVGNTAKGAVDAVDNVAGGVAGGGGGGGDKPLKLRLDLNLEVEVTLKARVHGDLTLALL